MDAAERHRELIAHLAAQGARLSEPQMVRIGRSPPAYEARIRGHECPMVPVAFAPGFAERQAGAVGVCGPTPFPWTVEVLGSGYTI